MRRTLFSLIASAVMLALPAQTNHPVRTSFNIPLGGINDGKEHPDPLINVTSEEEEEPGQESEQLEHIKDSLAAKYGNRQSAVQPASVLNAPVLGSTFAGNSFGNGTPTDNEIAIGNDGQLISVQNSNIFRYNTATSTYMGVLSLAVFFNPLQNNGSKYDPKVLYDPGTNRYVLVCLAGYLSGNTHIMVGFSNSDSINGTWNLYQLPGNPFNDSLWSDYPMMAVNNNELFITVNLLHDNQPWQTGFVETVIWQVNKTDGYNGDSLRVELHSGINTNGRPVRNLCPVESGALAAPGNDMYFLSDRNLDASNDTIFLVHVADTANSPTQAVTVTMLPANISYFAPVPADQPGTGGMLQTNDARIQGAFLVNNTIQFVCATLDTTTGNDGVYHGVIQNPTTTPAVTAFIYSDTALDYGYPNIAWLGDDGTDNTAAIMFLHSSTTVNPGHSAILVDGTGNFSPRLTIKNGLGPVSLISGDERWGDYTGIQRKYDVNGTCWVNGYYGLTNGAHATWISEIGRSADVGIAVQDTAAGVNVFPNPFADNINITFCLEEHKQIRFAIYDMQGKLQEILVDDEFRAGKNILSFNTAGLAPGAYILRAEVSDGSVLFTQRIIAN